MSLIKDISEYNAQKLAEFALTRQAIGRWGGEQVFLRWTEGRSTHLILSGQ
jgi:hypothetical protein